MRISDWSSDVCSSDLRDVGPALVQQGQLAVLAAEIVAPLRHAMGLVDGEQGDLRAVEQGQEARGEQALGGDVEQVDPAGQQLARSEEHTSELQSLMRIAYAVFCLTKNNNKHQKH